MDKPLLVEIIAYAPTEFYHCMHCEIVWHAMDYGQPIHREQAQSSLPDDLARDYQGISAWVSRLFDRYGDRLLVKVVDAASLEGVTKSLRYGVHRYPAVIVAGRERFTGRALEQAAGRIEQMLSEPLSTSSQR